MLVPIAGAPEETPPGPAIGGIALFERHHSAFTDQDLAHIVVIAEQIGLAIERIRQTTGDG
jgi:GAF domain-containing protein